MHSLSTVCSYGKAALHAVHLCVDPYLVPASDVVLNGHANGKSCPQWHRHRENLHAQTGRSSSPLVGFDMFPYPHIPECDSTT